MKVASPAGIDIYFDNVGGATFEVCASQMKLHGRIICCGAVSTYDGDLLDSRPSVDPRQIVVKRLMLKGFIMSDFNAERDRALADLKLGFRLAASKSSKMFADGMRPFHLHWSGFGWRKSRQENGARVIIVTEKYRHQTSPLSVQAESCWWRLRATKISADDPPSTWWPGER
jgi:hypothetical protein